MYGKVNWLDEGDSCPRGALSCVVHNPVDPSELLSTAETLVQHGALVYRWDVGRAYRRWRDTRPEAVRWKSLWVQIAPLVLAELIEIIEEQVDFGIDGSDDDEVTDIEDLLSIGIQGTVVEDAHRHLARVYMYREDREELL